MSTTAEQINDAVAIDIPGKESKSALLTHPTLKLRYPLVPDWIIKAITTRYGTGHFQNRFGLKPADTERVKALLLMLDGELRGDYVDFMIDTEVHTVLNVFGNWVHLPRLNHMLEQRGYHG